MKRLKEFKTVLFVDMTEFILKNIKYEHIQVFNEVCTAKYENEFVDIRLNFNYNYLSQNTRHPFSLQFSHMLVYFKHPEFENLNQIDTDCNQHLVIEHIQKQLNEES